jgi:hypothetical protein
VALSETRRSCSACAASAAARISPARLLALATLLITFSVACDLSFSSFACDSQPMIATTTTTTMMMMMRSTMIRTTIHSIHPFVDSFHHQFDSFIG